MVYQLRNTNREHDPGSSKIGETSEAGMNGADIAQVTDATIAAVRASLEKVLDLLDQSNTEHEEAMVILGMSDDYFIEPLTRHEVNVLACALFTGNRLGRGIVYHDVLRLTRKINGKAMNLTMVYRTIERLLDRGLMNAELEATVGDGRSKSYSINEHGRQAFMVAIINAEALRDQFGRRAA